MARPGGNPDLYKSGFTKDRQPAKNGRKITSAYSAKSP